MNGSTRGYYQPWRRSWRRYGSAYIGVTLPWTGPTPSTQSAPRPRYRGLEDALIKSFTHDAEAAAAPYVKMENVHAVAYLRRKGGEAIAVPYSGALRRSPIEEWFDRFTGVSSSAYYPPETWEFVAIVTLASDGRHRPRQPVVSSKLLSSTIERALRVLETNVGAWNSEGY